MAIISAFPGKSKPKLQSKTVETSNKTITYSPDSNYDGFSDFTVKSEKISFSINTSGTANSTGQSISINDVRPYQYDKTPEALPGIIDKVFIYIENQENTNLLPSDYHCLLLELFANSLGNLAAYQLVSARTQYGNVSSVDNRILFSGTVQYDSDNERLTITIGDSEFNRTDGWNSSFARVENYDVVIIYRDYNE